MGRRMGWLGRAGVALLMLAGCSGEVAPGAAPVEAESEARDEVAMTQQRESRTALHPELAAHIRAEVLPAIREIPDERRRALESLAAYVGEHRQGGEATALTFICTHNSRRSHLGQLWAATAAAFYGVDDVATFSGGTEATAFNPRAVAALRRAGFAIGEPEAAENPHYQVTFGPEQTPMEAFSKTYDDPFNPQAGFGAVMTCSLADRSCPVVMGADYRVSIPYEDPKEADDTPAEASRYDERSRQIASEMFYLFSQVDTS